MKLVMGLIFTLSISVFAQDDTQLFDAYMADVNANRVNKVSSLSYVKSVENKLFENISSLFDDLQVSMNQVGYIAPEDKVHEFSTKWMSHSKEVNIEKLLKNIIADPKLPLKDPRVAKILKDNRKYSQILRESFYIFDKDHVAPKKLQNIVKPFGKLNDAVVAGDPNLIEQYSSKVLKGYEIIDTKQILSEFDFINKKEFDEFYKTVKKDVKNLLKKSSHSVHDFHNLRKHHKKFLIIYFNLDGAGPTAKGGLLDNYITQLGDLNDIYVDMEMRFQVNFESHEILMDESIKRNMNKTMRFLEEDMISVKLGPSCISAFKGL